MDNSSTVKERQIICAVLLGTIVCMALRDLVSHGVLFFSIVNTLAQCSLDLAIAYVAFQPRCRKLVSPMAWGFLVVALADFTYGIQVNILAHSPTQRSGFELAYLFLFVVFYATAALFFLGILSRAQWKVRALGLGMAFLVGSALLLAQGMPVFTGEYQLGFKILHFVNAIVKSLVLGIALIALIFGRQTETRLIASGFLVVVAYSVMVEYFEVVGLSIASLPTEVFWTVGMGIILAGVLPLRRQDLTKDQVEWDLNSVSSRIFFYNIIIAGYVGLLWVALHLAYLKYPQLPTTGIFVTWCLVFILGVVLLGRYLRALFVAPLEHVLRDLENEPGAGAPRRTAIVTQVTEFQELDKKIRWALDKMHSEQRETRRLTQIAAQMSHDIRSPLAALRMLTNANDQIPEQTRRLMSDIASRIHLIADTLLKDAIAEKKQEIETRASCFLYPIMESIAAEKRLMIPGSEIALEVQVLRSDYGAVAAIQPGGFARVLSNLIGNSVDAFRLNDCISNKRICLVLSKTEDGKVRVSVQDNAGGMDPEVERKILSQPLSTKPDGFGLGLSHARQVVQANGGSLEVISRRGFGTLVNVVLNSLQTPVWMADQLRLQTTSPVVVIDDDVSMHSLWQARLPLENAPLHCNNCEEAEKVLSALPQDAVYLVDYELRGNPRGGLEFLNRLPSIVSAFLVTSHYEDQQVQREALRLKREIIPKFLVPFIPIHLETKIQELPSQHYVH